MSENRIAYYHIVLTLEDESKYCPVCNQWLYGKFAEQQLCPAFPL